LESYETGRFVADDKLRQLFNVASFQMEDLPKLIRPLLNAVPPLELEHTVRLSGTPQVVNQSHSIFFFFFFFFSFIFFFRKKK
jgi:hypothetical protein